MKYSILGFNQKKVCAITKEMHDDNNVKIYRLDVDDLIILQYMADFMNRESVIKYTINEKLYFSITHNAILKDLPILNIKKQALKDRLDKMCLLGVIEKQVIRNDGGTLIGYRLTSLYECLIYSSDDESGGGCIQLHGGVYSTTGGGVSNYTPNNYSNVKENIIKEDNIKENTMKKNKKEEDTNVSPKKNHYQSIVDCWNEYNGERLGRVTKLTEKRKKAVKRIIEDNGIDESQLMNFFKTLPYADSWMYNPNKQHSTWRPDFDWWMANTNGWLTKALEGKVHNENPQAFTTIMQGKEAPYSPKKNYDLGWSDTYNLYLYTGVDISHIPDGYTDDNRPHGATLMLNNARGTIVWDADLKVWVKMNIMDISKK